MEYLQDNAHGDGEHIVACLQQLKSCCVTADALKTSDIGKRVKAFVKSQDHQIATLAKLVISGWKDQLLSR